MITFKYLYLFLSILAFFPLLYLFFIYKPNKTVINNKILLKSILENLELDVPDELKTLDNPTPDPHKFS